MELKVKFKQNEPMFKFDGAEFDFSFNKVESSGSYQNIFSVPSCTLFKGAPIETVLLAVGY